MSCENKVSYYIARGFSYREVLAEIERHESDIAADNAAAKSAGWGEF